MSGRAWTDDEDDLIRQHAVHYSGSQVAKMLCGRTRNAVIGRAWRLGVKFRKPQDIANMIARRPKPPRASVAVTNKATGYARRATRLAPNPPQPAPSPLPPPDVPTIPTATVLTVRNGLCRWPIGEPDQPGFGLCGHRTTGSIYCPGHHRLAYQPGAVLARELTRSLRRFVA